MSTLTNKRLLVLTSVILFSTLISACSGVQINNRISDIPITPYADASEFGLRPEINDVRDIFALNEEQLADFKSFYDSHTNRRIKPNKRIYKYLQKYVKNYNYFNKTLTAEESISQAQGNCLSLAILTTALAKIVGVDTGYQLVESDPVYQKEGKIIISSQHVRSLLFDAKVPTDDGYLVLGRGKLIIDYFPVTGSHVRRTVEDKEFFAMYYRNSAADALINENFDTAYWLLLEALKLRPADGHSINMMAVVHENKGLTKIADDIYLHGIEYSEEKLDLLRNYHTFLTKELRVEEANTIQKRLTELNVVNPFDWINLGHTAYLQDNYSEARRYYKKALKIAPYLHQGHLGVAKSEFGMGNISASRASMKLAKKNAFDLDTQKLYQLKMNALANY